MPTINVHAPSPERTSATPFPLPPLLRTPLGMAILELQGTINFPAPPQPPVSSTASEPKTMDSTEVGRIEFPDYDPSLGAQEGSWMRRVWLFVGHQRMAGEVKELKPPVGLLRRRERRTTAPTTSTSTATAAAAEQDEDMLDALEEDEEQQAEEEELEILEIVRWKMVFRSRPEPVGALTE